MPAKEVTADVVLPELQITEEDRAYADAQFSGSDRMETTKPGNWHSDLMQIHALHRRLRQVEAQRDKSDRIAANGKKELGAMARLRDDILENSKSALAQAEQKKAKLVEALKAAYELLLFAGLNPDCKTSEDFRVHMLIMEALASQPPQGEQKPKGGE